MQFSNFPAAWDFPWSLAFFGSRAVKYVRKYYSYLTFVLLFSAVSALRVYVPSSQPPELKFAEPWQNRLAATYFQSAFILQIL